MLLLSRLAISFGFELSSLGEATHLLEEVTAHRTRLQISRLLKYSPASKPILPRSIVRAGLFSYPGITAPDPAYSGLI